MARRALRAKKIENIDKLPADKRVSIVDHVFSRVNQVIGETPGPDVLHWLPTGSTLLDLALSSGYGLPGGKTVEIYGKTGTCKTSICMMTALTCIQGCGGQVVWFDLEAGFSRSLAEDVIGLDISPPNFVYCCPEYADSVLEAIELIGPEHALSEEGKMRPLLIVVDSIPSIAYRDNMQVSIKSSRQQASGAAMLSFFYSRPWKNRIQGSNVFILLVNQVRSTLKRAAGSQDEEFTTPGGHAIPFYSYGRLELHRDAVIWDDDKKPRDQRIAQGVMISALVNKTKVTSSYDLIRFPFYTSATVPVRGLDDLRSCMTYLTARGALVRYQIQAGSWYSLGDIRVQGFDNFWAEVSCRPDLIEVIQNVTREVYLSERGLEITEDDVETDGEESAEE